MKKFTTLLLLAFAVLLLSVQDGLAQVHIPTSYYVKTTGSDANNGLSWGASFQTLQRALDVAVSGDYIAVATGTYKPTKESGGTGDRFKTFVMKAGVKIYGGFPSSGDPVLADRDFVLYETILSGDIGTPGDASDNSYHVIYNSGNGLSSSAVLDGFTVSGGNANGQHYPQDDGGGMYVDSSPIITNCTFKDNSANSSGGGIKSDGSSLLVTNCSFIGNTNSGMDGVGTIKNCIFKNNTWFAVRTGDNSSLQNCVFDGNEGGLLIFPNTFPLILNCSFKDDISCEYSSLAFFKNCIIWGGIYYETYPGLESQPTIQYSIVQGGWADVGNLSLNPQFINSNLQINPCSSPAIDAGTNSGAPATDLIGNPRPFNATVDMGAYEVQGIPIPEAKCKNATVLLDNDGNGSIAVSELNNNSTGCGPLTFKAGSQTTLSYDCSDASTLQIVTVTVTDIYGETDDCTAIITVKDEIKPTVTCKNATIYLSPTSSGGIIAGATATVLEADVVASKSDNCSSPSINISPNLFYCNGIGMHSVTVTAHDGNSNSGTCNSMVTVLDNTPPTARCKNADVNLNANGTVFVPDIVVNDGSSDNCSLLLSLSKSNFTCADVGPNTITMTATDPSNNQHSCMATVTIIDNTPPTAICQPLSIVLDPTGTVSINATDLNNGSTDACGIASFSASPNVLGCGELGENEITLTVTDNNGNENTCTATVTVTPFSAGIIYVDQNANGNNNGTSWDDAFTDLQSALGSCSVFTEIWVAAGTYLPTKESGGTDERNRTFSMLPGVKIYGGFAGGETNLSQRNWASNVTTLSGDIGTPGDDSDNCYHVIYNNNNGLDETAVLDGFTITRGNADGEVLDDRGGGMFNFNVSPTISNCTFSGNKAEEGGGMSNTYSDPTLKNCLFDGNEAIDGGGMYNRNASPTIEDCTFSENTATTSSMSPSNGSGGGMYNYASSPVVIGCDFTGNVSSASVWGGGGIFNNYESEAIITNCIFSENEASSGGGISNFLSSATVQNCTFNGNVAEDGGGIRNYNTTASSIVNCTFNENVAENNGGGMDNLGSTPTVTNCTFHQNEANIGAGMNNTSSSAVVTNCIFLENTAGFLGGGVNNLGTSTPSFTNCTISGNSAMDGGGGLANSDCTPAITNCIVWGNGSEFEDYMSTPTVTHSIVQGGYPGTGNLDADPLFVTPPTGGTGGADLRLLHCSPAINAGSNAAIPMGITTDLDGNTRIYNSGTVDMGAYELQAPFSYCCPAGNVVFVNKNALGKNTGETWDDAFTDLQGALDLIASGNCALVDEIWVAAGTYLPTKESFNTGDRYKTFVMLPGVKIYGGFAGGETSLNQRNWTTNVTILSGDIGIPGDSNDNCFHVIFNHDNGLDASAVLDGFTITAGKTHRDFSIHSRIANGAGMFNFLSSPSVSNCFFFGNTATAGGGMYNRQSSPTVYNCSFSGNTALWLGGGMINHFSSPKINNCSFYGNLADDEGGGMYISSSSPSVTNCILWGNGTEITNNNSTPSVTHSIVQGGYPGTGNLDADPLFVTPPTGGAGGADLRLMKCSPAIDAGSNAAIPMGITTDLDGNNRILNATGITTATVDMGAYEYTGSRNITAVCASPTVQLNADGNGSLTAMEVGSGSSADCSPLDVAIDVTSFTCADVGPNSVELTVTVPGLVGEGKCTASVTVEDNVLPTANCQPHTVQLDAMGNASISASDIDNGSTDACGIASLSVWPNTFDCVNVYTTNTVTLTVTDNNGNVNTCTATVTVEDNENPAPSCKTGTVQLDASGQYSLTENDVFAGGTDNCTIVNYWKITPTSVSCTDAGTTVPVLVEVFDASGNQASCTAHIFVEDGEMPLAICPVNIPDVVLDQNGLGTLPANIGDGSSTDNCSAIESSPAVTFNCIAGPQMVTLTVTDGFNTVTTDCSFNVVDNQVPVAHCPANIPGVQLDANGNGSLPANIGDSSSTDNCSVLETSPVLNFTCSDVGIQTVVLTASDGTNSTTINCSFNVVDNISPAANCISQTIQVSLNANAQYTLDPNQLDDGSTDACGIQSRSVSPAILGCQHEGTTAVTLNVTDQNGNTASCTANVEVAEFLTINNVSATAESCAGMGDGSITILATAGGGQLKYSIDGGASFQTGNTFGNLMPGIYNIVVKVFGVPSVCEKTATATVAVGNSLTTWYKDMDGDGYTDGVTQTGCQQPAGFVATAEPGDCNDNDPLEHPGQVWYEDLDGDGYGSGVWSTACQRPAGCYVASELVAVDTDCDDLNAAVSPVATEICDGFDNDCDGETDEGLAGTYIGNVLFTTQAQLDAWLACYDVIQGSVTIQGGNITDLSPLSNITEITGNLMILMNGALTSLDGLENLTTVGGALFLYYNFQLSDCCALYGLLNNNGVGGTMMIFYNKVGCNSSNEILNGCAPSGNLVALPNGGGVQLAEQIQKERMTIFPNPASGSISVRTKGMEDKTAVLTIANSTGLVVERIVVSSLERGPIRIETSHLKDGLYTLTLKAEGAKQVCQRFVKMDSAGAGY